jgi:hypothetical protein
MDIVPKKLPKFNINYKSIKEPVWLSVTESAVLCGVNNKTIRRAILNGKLKFKIYKNRYLVEFGSLLEYMFSNTKLKNKFLTSGLGQYIVKWETK